MTRIDDIKARLDAATDGPWWDESGVIHAKAPHWTPEVHSCDHVAKADPHENATFIANAPADIAYLLRLVALADSMATRMDWLLDVELGEWWTAARKRAEETET